MSYTGVFTVKVIEAKEITAADKTGTSDPFVVLSLERQKKTTQMIERTVAPEWNESFTFYTSSAKKNILRVKMFDYDQYSADDEIGECVLKVDGLEEGKTVDEWIPLKNPEKGEIHLEYSYRALAENEEISVEIAEDDDDPELVKLREKGETYWPLKGSVYGPSNYAPNGNSAKPPREKLDLEFVYGYRGHDCRDNLYHNDQGHIVFTAAAVCVVYSTEVQKQKFFKDHSDDIVAMAMHPNKEIFATGQVASTKGGKFPKIYIWNSKTLENLGMIDGEIERSVCALAFSSDGNHLVAVGTDEKNSLFVYDWQKKKSVAHANGHTQKIFVAQFSPKDPTLFVTCGVKHIKFWKLENGKLTAKDGLFKKFAIQTFLNLDFTADGLVVAGGYSGDVFVWDPKTAEVVCAYQEAHKGPVYSVLNTPQGVFTSGKDGKVLLWGSELNAETEPSKKIDILSSPAAQLWDETVCVRSMSFSNNTLLLGTKNNEMYSVTLENDDIQLLMGGHFEEFWGLATHSTKPLFVTSGKDKALRLWNYETKKIEKIMPLEEEGTCCDIMKNSDLAALGTESGKVLLIDLVEWKIVKEIQDSKLKIDDVRFSNDQRLLAVGGHDAKIHIYFSEKDWGKIGVCKGHSSAVLHLDWSVDSKVIQSDSSSYEHLFWDLENIQQITKVTAVRDLEWASWNCTLGWGVKSIWPKGADGTDINATSRSSNGKIVATSDDFGEVKIFRFPCAEPNAGFRNYEGHSAHVTNVCFSFDDSKLISIGGNDRAIFQWRVTHPTGEEEHSEPEKVNNAASTPTKTPAFGGNKKPPGTTPQKTKVVETKGKSTPSKDPKATTPIAKRSPSSPSVTTTRTPAKKVGVSSTPASSAPSDNDRISKLEKRVEELETIIKSLKK